MSETVSSVVETPAPLVANGYELHISRMFDAPRAVVYEAFTNPAMLSHWMGPRGFHAMNIEHDVKPGGRWRLRLHVTGPTTDCDPHGYTDLWMQGTYLEVAPPERLVYTFAWDGRTDIPYEETTITVTFRELEGKTVMDFKQGPFASSANRDEHSVGWTSSFDRFAEFLLAPVGAEKTHDLVIERVFDAPRELVWQAWTDPALAVEWMAPRGFRNIHFEQDARPGGKWRACMHSDGFDAGDGKLMERNLWKSGTYHEVIPPERLVYTFAWDNPGDIGFPGPRYDTRVTVEFKEQGAKTAMHFRQEFFPSARERDSHNGGWNSLFERLAELLQTKARPA